MIFGSLDEGFEASDFNEEKRKEIYKFANQRINEINSFGDLPPEDKSYEINLIKSYLTEYEIQREHFLKDLKEKPMKYKHSKEALEEIKKIIELSKKINETIKDVKIEKQVRKNYLNYVNFWKDSGLLN